MWLNEDISIDIGKLWQNLLPKFYLTAVALLTMKCAKRKSKYISNKSFMHLIDRPSLKFRPYFKIGIDNAIG